MTKNQRNILILLEVAKDNLKNALDALIQENTGGNQFDYVTSSLLSEVFDDVNNLNAKLDVIIYQKDKK